LISIRLAGLTSNLSFELFRGKGCEVKVEVDCGGGDGKEIIEGKICNSGTDYVDILQKNDKVTTILLNRVCRILWKDPNCNPCNKCGCEKKSKFFFDCDCENHFVNDCNCHHKKEKHCDDDWNDWNCCGKKHSNSWMGLDCH
jgi:hypothetical protein